MSIAYGNSMYLKYYLLSLLLIAFVLTGCSSKETVKEKEIKKPVVKEIPPAKKILNFDLKDREYIRNNSIMTIDKIRFDYDKDKKLNLVGKLSTANYDKNGFLVSTIIYGKDETPRDSYTYKYDPYGTRIETDRMDANGVPVDKFTYEYDKHGNKIKSIRYDLDNKMEKYYLYKYDSNGNLTDDKWYDASGKLEYKIINKYDNDGNKMESYSYGEDGNLLSHYTYRLDDKGNIVEEAEFDIKGRPVGIVQYVYKYY
ncbi:MAG: hypothetical protein P4L35_19835 [Ignavibacteriaceae bacterium]|nr:hypothetical protein [Ignavibacteriaceae bacterium]